LIRGGDKQSGATETFLINHTGDKWFARETSDGPLIYQSKEKPAMEPACPPQADSEGRPERISSLDLLLTFVSRQK